VNGAPRAGAGCSPTKALNGLWDHGARGRPLRKSGAWIFLVASSFVLLRPLTSLASDRAPYSIADFESQDGLQNWRFTGGAGTLTLGPGHRGRGAILNYQLPCAHNAACGASAEALWTPPSALPKWRDPAISLWIRVPADVEVSLVVKDTSGQTLRFPIGASIEHSKPGDWQYVVIPLSPKPEDGGPYHSGGVKGRLVEAGIFVQARARVSVAGAVSFDDIQLRDAAEVLRVDPTAQTTLPLPESLAPPRVGVNIHLLHDDHALDLAHAAGFAFVRMDMLWANVERGGRYRFFAYDTLLRALEARGMGVLWILDYGHPDHGGSTPQTPQDIAAFGRFAEAAAAHFKGRNVRYEIWNEPNTSHFWPPSPNPTEYAALLQEAAEAIRREDPSAPISSGGLAQIDESFLSRTVDQRLASGLTAIGVHPYPKAGPENIALAAGTLREWMAHALGERIEIWDTEWGYSSANAPKEAPSNGHTEAGRRRQAALAVREMLTVWALGLPLAVWYDLRDDGPDPANPEHNYGLLDASGNEKPAMVAIRNFLTTAGVRRYAGMMQETPAGVHCMRFDGAGDTVLIVWNDRAGERSWVEYPRQNLISATDTMGQAAKFKERSSGIARVELDDAIGPLYLCWSK
jgi:hypothetical protein